MRINERDYIKGIEFLKSKDDSGSLIATPNHNNIIQNEEAYRWIEANINTIQDYTSSNSLDTTGIQNYNTLLRTYRLPFYATHFLNDLGYYLDEHKIDLKWDSKIDRIRNNRDYYVNYIIDNYYIDFEDSYTITKQGVAYGVEDIITQLKDEIEIDVDDFLFMYYLMITDKRIIDLNRSAFHTPLTKASADTVMQMNEVGIEVLRAVSEAPIYNSEENINNMLKRKNIEIGMNDEFMEFVKYTGKEAKRVKLNTFDKILENSKELELIINNVYKEDLKDLVVLNMRYFESRSYREITRITGLKSSQISNIIRRFGDDIEGIIYLNKDKLTVRETASPNTIQL